MRSKANHVTMAKIVDIQIPLDNLPVDITPPINPSPTAWIAAAAKKRYFIRSKSTLVGSKPPGLEPPEEPSAL